MKIDNTPIRYDLILDECMFLLGTFGAGYSSPGNILLQLVADGADRYATPLRNLLLI